MLTSNKIIFLSVPESLKEEMQHLPHHHDEDEEEDHAGHIHNSFDVDTSIPLPVELENGAETLDPETLSWEMILSGMMKIVAAEEPYPGVEPQWIGYYRRFVLAVKPEIYNELTSAAIVKAENSDFDMALEILGLLEGLFPGAPGILLNKALMLEEQAEALEKTGNEAAAEVGEKALAAYEKVLMQEPPLPDALFNAGFFFIRHKDYGRARSCFNDYLPIADNEEKKEQAEALAKDIENRGLDDESFREAVELIRSGEDQEGLLTIKDFIENHPTVWNGWFVLGWALRKLERWEDSLESFRKAVEFGGDSGDVRNEMAICLIELGDLENARKELEAALKEEPENVKIISNLGVVALKNGNDDEAAAFFRTVLELDPNDPVANGYMDNRK
ncbi:tetratricopeptide repeat protein [Leadbettera azotonutricia]|uniref:Tetratricopeptide repeat protein n=1 Tax=Leadbettera azotonutricia (strain ATCC BAA-888 / DSM 13862 / ZAS-9) TaxID=545695 RepID=F5Y792_LEAAZ|nr:tetratricopeptide repeat protein [Leadbettera azotonutricia]AEF81796.1 tetratricopeptide repeat protein [Leadbettera azotonutricia ZAS-9]